MCGLISKIDNATNAHKCPNASKQVDKKSEIFAKCLILKNIIKFGARVINFVNKTLLVNHIFIEIFMYCWWLSYAVVELRQDSVFVNYNSCWNNKPY